MMRGMKTGDSDSWNSARRVQSTVAGGEQDRYQLHGNSSCHEVEYDERAHNKEPIFICTHSEQPSQTF